MPDSPSMISVTMTPEAAEKFKAALSYGSAVLESMADANKAPATRAKIEEHVEWLSWGRSRVAQGEKEADPLAS